MSISQDARRGLRSVIEWNPYGAKMLYAILRETPEWVKYKDDPYGPLGLILFGVENRVEIGNGVSIPVKQSPFPSDALNDCEVFGREWKQKRFTKDELADAVSAILDDINQSRG